jgi:hypothetical protein
MPKGLIVSLHGHFYSVLFVVTLDSFYLPDVRCWFCYLCFVVPIAPIPSCFDGRSVIFLGFLSCHARRPRDGEHDRQVIASGPKLQPTPLRLSHPRFWIVPYGIHPTHLRPWPFFLFSSLSAYPPLRFPSNSLRWLVLSRSQAIATRSLQPHSSISRCLSFVKKFPLHVKFLYFFYARLRLFCFPFSR